jgi:hypothetical protein
MSGKALRAGGEVDSWCTKCKLLLNHRIIAMEGGIPARVECSTCFSHHNFRPRPPGERAERTPSAGAVTGRSAGSGGSAGPRSTRMSISKAQQAALEREKTWEKAIAGKGVHDFRLYKVSETFAEGDLVRHTKFGDGVVTRILDQKKVEVLFKDDARTLAQGLTD